MSGDIDVLIDFGNRLKAIRLKKGLSQEKLALESSLDRTYISSVERGQRNISLLNIYKIAHALDITAHDLMIDTGGHHEKN